VDFNVILVISYNIILSLPWLEKYNPVINWGSGYLTFSKSLNCDYCLKKVKKVLNCFKDARSI